MPWIPITVTTLNEASVAALVTACSRAAKAAGQPDRAPGLIQGVVDEVRRKVASNVANQVDADPATIPASLRDLAVTMILARLKGAVQQPLSEDERRGLERCDRELNRVADGKDQVDQPADAVPAPVQSTAGTPAITPRERRFSRAQQDGI